jgi:two-component system OmpR family sensor kinase
MRTIRQQLLIGLLSGTLACTLIAGAAMYLKVREEANELFDYQLKQVAGSLPAQFSPQSVQPRNDETEDDTVIQAWDRSGGVLYTSHPALSLPRYPAIGFKTVSALNDRWRVYGELRHDRFVQVAQPTSVRQELAAGLAFRSLMPFLILLPVLAVLIGVVVRRSLRPLHEVAEAVARRSPSSLHPLPTDGLPPEVRPMLDSLNELLQQLDHALSSQRAFVADAAHELRSPLTALKLQLQLAERAKTDQQRVAAFAKLHERLDRSTRLVQQLLTLARQEQQISDQDCQEVDLYRLAQQVVADHSTLAESKAIDLGVEAAGSAPFVKGQADSLRILLSNLVDNAISYTPAGGRVDALALMVDGYPALRVSDTGPGIPMEDRLRVFDRFYRAEGSNVSGSGLGLSIVKNIADHHRATIHLNDNAPSSGLVVTVVFPKIEKPRSVGADHDGGPVLRARERAAASPYSYKGTYQGPAQE